VHDRGESCYFIQTVEGLCIYFTAFLTELLKIEQSNEGYICFDDRKVWLNKS